MNIYMESEILNKKLKYDQESDIITIEEKRKSGKPGYVTYSFKEIETIDKCEINLNKKVHLIKNIFDGTIIDGGIKKDESEK